MPPKASLVTCLGHPGHQNRPRSIPKGSRLLYLLACWFEGRVFFDIWGFLNGPTLDPLAQAQSKRSFVIFGVASKRVSFPQQLLEHFWYSWRRDPLKRYLKIEFEKRSCQSVFVLLSGSILASSGTRYVESFRASGALAPSKRQGFLEPGALDSQKVVVSHLVWGHISRFLESGA